MAKKVLYGKEAMAAFWRKIVETFRITIPECPFSGKPIVFVAPGEPARKGYRETLTNNELLLLAAAVPDLSTRKLDAFLRRVYHFTGDELKNLTWNEIGVYAQDYLESQNTTPAKPARKTKEPPKEARIAYQLYCLADVGTQTEVARMMSRELGRKIGQHSVSRWTTEYRAWLEQQGLPTDNAAPKAGKTLVNTDAFKLGARTDGRKPPKKPTK